jgi:hypothetical protein
MATQEEMLAELRALNAELGLSENDGIESTSTYEQNLQELRALDEELASTPESFDEYVARRKQDDSRSLGEKTSAFTDSFITGAGTLAEEGGRAIKQLFAGDVGLKEAKGVFQVGVKDFGRFAETLGGAAMDNFYSDENEMQREYERYKDNFLYNQNVRTAMLDTFDEKGRDFVSFGANFVDPTMFIPIAGQVAKATSIGLKSARLGKVAKAIEKGGAIASKPTELIAKGTRKALEKTAQAGSKIAGATGKAGEVTSKVAAFPRDMVTRFASKTIDPKVAGSGILGAQVTGAFTGAVPGLGLLTSAEVAGYIANKSGRGMERVLTALGSEAGQKRFLQRLAMQADSPTTRKLALYAHKLGGTRMGDMAFNSLVNGISVSTLNGALAYASTDNIEELGQAMGAGFAMGGALPVGQPGMRAGRSQASRNQSSVNFLEAKLGQDQLKQFRKMDPDARLAFATVEEAGIKAPKLMFVDKNLMLETLRQDDPNIRQAPNAYFDQKDNTIYVNENGRASKSSKEAFDILTHELGHGFITQAIKDDPLFARKILEQYEAKPGQKSFEFAFTKDSAGAPIDSIMLNEDAKKIASAYDNIQEGDKSIGVGQDANLLAQEIGAEQFAMMMVDNPNYFNTIEPSLRQKLLEGSRKVLTLFGAVDGNTGNPLDVSISPILKRNKSIRNLYKNYTKQRDASIADKVDLAEKGVSMKVRKGESADQAVERLYGKQGISLKEAGAFRIDNKKVKNELTNILNRVDETPEGGMSSERNPKSGRPQAIVGKQLSDEVKGVFTRKDPRGTINMLINDITESIRNRLQLNFLYRSGKPSKYSDNELKARVVSPVRFKVTGLSKTSRSAASLKMDAIDEAYLRNNVEILTKEGFADNPSDLIELARKVAREALDDEEGRINPEGKYENELVTAVFGQPESAPQIRNAKLRQLLEDKKLQHAYRSYDVDALAGLVPTGKSGIAFDWFNIKNNYSPFDDKLFIPAYHGTPHTLAPEAGAPLGKFRTSKIGTGEGAQAYGHGLYFAGKREVAEHYRKVLSGRKDDILQEYDGKPFDRTNPKHEAARRLNKEARMLGVNKDQVRGRVQSIIENRLQRRGLDQTIEEGLQDTLEVIKNKQEAKTDDGSLYKVELAPKENEYLLWDKPLSEQPKGVREKIKQVYLGKELPEPYQTKISYPGMKSFIGQDLPSTPKQEAVLTLLGEKGNKLSAAEILKNDSKALEALAGIEYSKIKETPHGQVLGLHIYNDLKFGSNPIAASAALKEAGIPGIKYLDGSSRSKGEGDYNYVIFDEADVTVTEKLFMPASEAGAGKGKQAEKTLDRRNFLKLIGITPLVLSKFNAESAKKVVPKMINKNQIVISSLSEKNLMQKIIIDEMDLYKEDNLVDSPNYEDLEGSLNEISKANRFPAKIELSSSETSLIKPIIDQSKLSKEEVLQSLSFGEMIERIEQILKNSNQLSTVDRSTFTKLPAEEILNLMNDESKMIQFTVNGTLKSFKFIDGELVPVQTK